MPEDRTLALGVIILAAGHSSRMGRPKLLLRWGETTVIAHLIAQWSHVGARQIAIVHQAGNQPILTELERLQFPTANRITNPDPDRGMFSSIQCAATWAGWQPNLNHFSIVLGDQPHVGGATLEALLQFSRQYPNQVCQPSHRGRARHPVVLPANHFKDLARATERNLKDFLSARTGEVRLLELEDPALDLDIDRPEDYENAVRLFLKK